MVGLAAPGAATALAFDLAQVSQEVDLDGVPLGGEITPADLLAVSRYLPVKLGSTWQLCLSLEQVSDPFGLRLGERHDRAEGLNQSDEVQPSMIGIHHPMKQG